MPNCSDAATTGATRDAACEREVAVKTACGPVAVTRQSDTPFARWNSAAAIKSDPLVDSLIENSFESCQSLRPVTSEDPAQIQRYSRPSAGGSVHDGRCRRR